ncbi:hypothetical protein KAF25_002055 [Fusarium avenaceum]|uniref:BTB domain-containing protein n=1 Tax=Fusarium avenaceum TaxID=40199 RepID=A0A9P7GZG3_9HYPO|nr:hypothetical protein KAF25_002055 [Fusarium avenaceum]
MHYLKQIVAVRRKSGLTRQEFFDYHFQVYGKISTAPSPEETSSRYFQTHLEDAAYHPQDSSLSVNANPRWVFSDDITEPYYQSTEHLDRVSKTLHVKETVGSDGLNSSDLGIAKPTLGTLNKPAPLPMFQKYEHNELVEYQTFIFDEEYRDFSAEEHRLADYNRRPSFANTSRVDRAKLELLRGSGIEIRVGTSLSSDGETENKAPETWCLPRNLISHYSPFLKAACQGSDKGIEITEHDPTTFGVFVEWMYYGSYNVSSLSSMTNIDVKCYLLGNKLQCGGFQDIAMRHLYGKHMGVPFSRPVTIEDVRYVLENTPPRSKLRAFYTDFVMQYFACPGRLLGSLADWDGLLQKHPTTRIQLLQRFRVCSAETRMGAIDEYLGFDDVCGSQLLKQPIELTPLAVRTKKHEAEKPKSERTDTEEEYNSQSSGLDQEPSTIPDSEPLLGHADEGNKSVGGKVEDVAESPETEKGKAMAERPVNNLKESEVGGTSA